MPPAILSGFLYFKFSFSLSLGLYSPPLDLSPSLRVSIPHLSSSPLFCVTVPDLSLLSLSLTSPLLSVVSVHFSLFLSFSAFSISAIYLDFWPYPFSALQRQAVDCPWISLPINSRAVIHSSPPIFSFCITGKGQVPSVHEWRTGRSDRKKLEKLLHLPLPGDGGAHKWTPAVGPHCTVV